MRKLYISEYLEELDHELDSAIQDAYWSCLHEIGGASRLLEAFVIRSAEADGVEFRDPENLEDQVWAAYTVAEKGLS